MAKVRRMESSEEDGGGRGSGGRGLAGGGAVGGAGAGASRVRVGARVALVGVRARFVGEERGARREAGWGVGSVVTAATGMGHAAGQAEPPCGAAEDELAVGGSQPACR